MRKSYRLATSIVPSAFQSYPEMRSYPNSFTSTVGFVNAREFGRTQLIASAPTSIPSTGSIRVLFSARFDTANVPVPSGVRVAAYTFEFVVETTRASPAPANPAGTNCTDPVRSPWPRPSVPRFVALSGPPATVPGLYWSNFGASSKVVANNTPPVGE